MFERDKAELREMGVPLETGRTSVFDTEDGYRIARADYELPEIKLDRRGGRGRRPGAAAVGVRAAGRRRAQRAGQAQGRRASTSTPPGAIPLQPRLDAGEPAFEPCYAAARDRRALEFDYQPPRRGRARPPARAAVGRRRLARPLVPRRPRPRPAGAAGVPALPRRRHPEGHRPGRRLRAAGRRRPRRRSSPARSGARSTWSSSAPGPGTAIGLRRRADPARRRRRRRRPARAAHHRARPAGRPARRLRRRRRRRGARPTVRDAVIDRLTRLAAMGEPRHDAATSTAATG